MNAGLFCRSNNQFSWDNLFPKINVNQKVYLFNQTIKNILSNFIPYLTLICDDSNPRWINSKIEGLILPRSVTNKDIQLYRRFQWIQNLLITTAEKSK